MSSTSAATLLPGLLRRLNPKVAADVDRRYSAMLRELQYIQERRSEAFVYILRKGWSVEKLKVIFVLNSVYQLCIGPMRSSARVSKGLGDKIPIHHGSEVFDQNRAKSVNKMADEFSKLVEDLGFRRDWVRENTAGDLIYKMSVFEKDREESLDGAIE